MTKYSSSGFWPNLDPDPVLCYQFWKNVTKKGFREKSFPLKKIFLKAMAPEEIFSQLGLSDWWTFVSYLSYFHLCGCVFGIRVRILKVPEYGSNLDPDPQHWCPPFIGRRLRALTIPRYYPYCTLGRNFVKIFYSISFYLCNIIFLMLLK